MAFWGLEVKSGKPTPLNLERRLVIKQAALSISKSSSEPVVLSVSVNGGKGQQFVVCRLHEGKIEHCPLELPFTPEDQPHLHLKGAHTVHLTGFLEMEEEDELEEDEEMGDATATKVAPPKAKGKPVPAVDEDDDDDDDEGEEEDDDEGEEEDDGEEDDDDDDDDDDDEEEEEEVAPPPKASAKRPIPAAAPPAKKAKAEQPKAATPKAAAPKASAASPASNSWSAAEDSKLQKAMAKIGESVDNRWDKIAKEMGTRSKDQCKKRLKALKSPA